MRRRQEIICWRERHAGSDAGCPECVDETTSRHVKGSDNGIERCRDQPSRVRGECLQVRSVTDLLYTANRDTYDVQYTAPEASQFTDHSPCLNINDADDKVVADNRKEPTISMQRDRDTG